VFHQDCLMPVKAFEFISCVLFNRSETINGFSTVAQQIYKIQNSKTATHFFSSLSVLIKNKSESFQQEEND
jgi:hypothetical protein